MRRAFGLALVGASLAACGGSAGPARHTAAPPPITLAPQSPTLTTTPDASVEGPPPPGPTLDLHLPRTTWIALDNGLRVGVMRTTTRPLVEVRLVVAGGRAFDGERTGLAALTAELLRRSTEADPPRSPVAVRFAALGARLEVHADTDATTYSLRVPPERTSDAMDALAAMVRAFEPAPREFAQARAALGRALQRRAELDADFDARMILFADLYDQPLGRHPYSSYDALPREIEGLAATELRAYFRRAYTPRAMAVLVAGDTSMEATRSDALRAFGALRGAEPPGLTFAEPTHRTTLKLSIADRPGAETSHVLVGWLGPERLDPRWPVARLATTVLADAAGHGARAELVERANGPSAWLLVADAPTAETVAVIHDALDAAERLTNTPPSAQALDAAQKRLFDATAMDARTLAQLADRAALRPLLGLADDADEAALQLARATPPEVVPQAFVEWAEPTRAVVVVVGDAARIGDALAPLAEVKIVAPTRGFERDRTLRYNPAPGPR